MTKTTKAILKEGRKRPNTLSLCIVRLDEGVCKSISATRVLNQ